MDNKNQERLNDLSQQQLIDSILGRKNLQHEALVEATKKSVDNPEIDINKEKSNIENKKIAEIEVKNNNEMQQLRREIIEEEVEIELKKWQEEEKIQAEKRRIETERILQELEITRKKRIRLERKENEVFRRKYNNIEEKRNGFLNQIKKIVGNKSKSESVKNEKQEIKQNKGAEINNPVYSNLILDKTKYDPREIKTTTIQKEKSRKDKKVDFKMYNAIQRYVTTMEFYERNKYILQRGRQTIKSNSTVKETSSKRKSFIEHLISAVDHKKALESVQNKRNERPSIRPRIID